MQAMGLKVVACHSSWAIDLLLLIGAFMLLLKRNQTTYSNPIYNHDVYSTLKIWHILYCNLTKCGKCSKLGISHWHGGGSYRI
jgi:hypothetical protein